jgi:hypothetical protein
MILYWCTCWGEVTNCYQLTIINSELKQELLWQCYWRNSLGYGLRNHSLMFNWLKWKVTHWISSMLQLVDFKFLEESVAIDIDWLDHGHVSLLIGLWNQLGLSQQLLISIGCSGEATFLLQCVTVNSWQSIVRRCHNELLVDWPVQAAYNGFFCRWHQFDWHIDTVRRYNHWIPIFIVSHAYTACCDVL